MNGADTYQYERASENFGRRVLSEVDATPISGNPQRNEGQIKASLVAEPDGMEWKVTVTVNSSRRNYAKPDDWVTQRERITDLYRRNPLPVVVEIMGREHDFWASEKMYKDRFKKWRVNTKNKKPSFRAKRRKHAPDSKASMQITALSHLSRSNVLTTQTKYILGHQVSLSQNLATLRLPDFDHSEVMLIAFKNWIKSSIESIPKNRHIPAYLYMCYCCASQIHKHMFSEYSGEKTSTHWIGNWSNKRYTQTILNEIGGIFNASVLAASLAWLLSLLLGYIKSFDGLSQRNCNLHQLLTRSQFNLKSAHPLVLIVTGLGAPNSSTIPLAARTIECIQNVVDTLTHPRLQPYTEFSMKLDQIILVLKYLYGGLGSNDFLLEWKNTVDKGTKSLPLFSKAALDIRLVYLRLLNCFRSKNFVPEARKCLALTVATRWRICAEYRALFFIEIAEASYCHNEILYAIEYMKEVVNILSWIEDTWLEQKREEAQSVLNDWIRSCRP